jgi:hypothetical protein
MRAVYCECVSVCVLVDLVRRQLPVDHKRDIRVRALGQSIETSQREFMSPIPDCKSESVRRENYEDLDEIDERYGCR